MSKNLANIDIGDTLKLQQERQRQAIMKRIRKANNYAKATAHGGFGEQAKSYYLTKYPEAKTK